RPRAMPTKAGVSGASRDMLIDQPCTLIDQRAVMAGQRIALKDRARSPADGLDRLLTQMLGTPRLGLELESVPPQQRTRDGAAFVGDAPTYIGRCALVMEQKPGYFSRFNYS